jgi:class 3 adenylate cyclase
LCGGGALWVSDPAMQSNWKTYEYEQSFARLDGILNQSDVAYEETDALPNRDKLTFSNGFYAYCSALFVDIRDSSDLPNKYKRPTLARLYRAYISEMVAVMNRDPDCKEINIVGDAVWSVINTPKKSDINYVFSTAAMANSLVKTLNCKLRKRGNDPISVGIGMEYGRALMIKAGYEGSGINDVVYMGDVVNGAAKLAAAGNDTWSDEPLMVGEVFYNNLNNHNKGLLTWNQARGCWHGNVVNSVMDEWYEENCS